MTLRLKRSLFHRERLAVSDIRYLLCVPHRDRSLFKLYRTALRAFTRN